MLIKIFLVNKRKARERERERKREREKLDMSNDLALDLHE